MITLSFVLHRNSEDRQLVVSLRSYQLFRLVWRHNWSCYDCIQNYEWSSYSCPFMLFGLVLLFKLWIPRLLWINHIEQNKWVSEWKTEQTSFYSIWYHHHKREKKNNQNGFNCYTSKSLLDRWQYFFLNWYKFILNAFQSKAFLMLNGHIGHAKHWSQSFPAFEYFRLWYVGRRTASTIEKRMVRWACQNKKTRSKSWSWHLFIL